ncbi:hypothetical protein DSM3645_29102 [Blastopirellula marina DSM 3645]|uniref:Uncharacterized protein n=1 Tax=Blastopirellula marina DSM 3645 TaxID=314230 RepID=A3ZPP2_9BACT|nr:hypothetical protein DSM3645_29102 [Blastopirellula marina DSM 3645]
MDHVFDVPVELFAAFTGIRYDMDLPGSTGDDYETLQPIR